MSAEEGTAGDLDDVLLPSSSSTGNGGGGGGSGGGKLTVTKQHPLSSGGGDDADVDALLGELSFPAPPAAADASPPPAVPPTSHEEGRASAAAASAADPWAVDPTAATTTVSSAPDATADSAAGAPDEDAAAAAAAAERDEKIRRLRDSSARLGSALAHVTSELDGRLGVSRSVRDLDSAYRISDAVRGSLADAGRMWSSFRVGERAREVGERAGGAVRSARDAAAPAAAPIVEKAGEAVRSAREKAGPVVAPLAEQVAESVRPVGAKVTEGVEKIHLRDKLEKAGKSVKELDERHHITAKTVDAVAGGMEAIASGITGGRQGEAGGDYEGLAQEDDRKNDLELLEKDKDGFPTSFQKEDRKNGGDDEGS